MFELRIATPIGGDETAGYRVQLDKEYTVKEFVDAVLTIKNEHGGIYIDKGNSCGYSRGVLSNSSFTPEDLNKKVIEATSVGGWGRMDYHLKVK
jgi:hypothetical protein